MVAWYIYLQKSYIYHILPLKTTIHVGKYTSPMDDMGIVRCLEGLFITEPHG